MSLFSLELPERLKEASIMFVLNEEDSVVSSAPAPPGPDANVLELIKYNSSRLLSKYLGNEQQRPQNLRLLYNIACFCTASVLIQQIGDKFAV